MCSKPSAFPNELFEFHQMTYEEFMKVNKSTYDLILHCHDLYYLDNKKQVLRECLDRLDDDGFMIVILEDSDGIAHVRQKFCPTKYYFPSNLMNELIENDSVLSRCLDCVIDVDGYIDIKEDSSSDESDYLLNFFLLGNSEKLEELRAYLRTRYPSDMMQQTSKMFIFHKRESQQ